MSNLETFYNRVDRIEAGQQVTADYLVYGRIPNKRAIRQRRFRLGVISSVTVLFLVGLLTVVLVRYGRLQLFGVERASLVSLEGMVLDMGATSVSLLIVLLLTKVNSMAYAAAHVMGSAASFFGMHLAVHRWPDLFMDLFSPGWLFMVMQSTRPDRFILELSLGG